MIAGLLMPLGQQAAGTGSAAAPAAAPAAAAAAPNIFFYNLDDLRDAFPGAIDPLQFMPKTRAWMADRAPVHPDVRRRTPPAVRRGRR